MDKEHVAIDLRTLRSPLILIAAVLCFLAFALGVPGIISLFTPEYREYLLQDLVAGGVTDRSSLTTYTVIHYVVAVIAPLTALLMAASLTLTLRSKADKGLGLLATAADRLVRVLFAAGIALAGLFAFKFISYTVWCLGINGGVYPLYSMVISEGLMGVLAAVLFFNLRKFVRCVSDSSRSIAYTISSGKIASPSIAPFTVLGFLLLAVFCVLAAGDQLFTLTIQFQKYKILTASHPAQLAAAAGFLCAGAANAALFLYLRKYKSTCEYILYQNRKLVMDAVRDNMDEKFGTVTPYTNG